MKNICLLTFLLLAIGCDKSGKPYSETLKCISSDVNKIQDQSWTYNIYVISGDDFGLVECSLGKRKGVQYIDTAKIKDRCVVRTTQTESYVFGLFDVGNGVLERSIYRMNIDQVDFSAKIAIPDPEFEAAPPTGCVRKFY